MEKHRMFSLIENSGNLPVIPQHISEILTILRDPIEVDIDELVQKLTKSEQLNSIMLKNLNSGYFRLNKKLESIKEAVIYLGMQTVQNLMIFFITYQLFSTQYDEKERAFNMKKYWKHVLGTSVASCILADRIKYKDKYKLFSYGLIHDIGISVLDVCLPDIVDEITTKLQNGMHQIIAEKVVLGGLTHADIGAWVCRKWGIREDIIRIVELHHTPLLAKDELFEVKLLNLADTLSSEYYARLMGVYINHNLNTRIMESLNLTEDDLKYAIELLPREIERTNNYFVSI
jgi:HD-like signal output (HDOD) protein